MAQLQERKPLTRVENQLWVSLFGHEKGFGAAQALQRKIDGAGSSFFEYQNTSYKDRCKQIRGWRKQNKKP